MASRITALSAMMDDNSVSVLSNAAEALAAIGATTLCHPSSHDFAPFFPQCEDVKIYPADWRDLADGVPQEGAEEDWFYLRNGLLSTLCVVVAALAAGLTMGLMSLDPLMLHIKKRAGATEQERQHAAALLPVVKKHHLLLVTLLLLNALANEALPLFLDKLVPSPVLTIICSVTLVLFFGEIIPSAVFTGPNQLQIAARLIPLVNIVMTMLLPIAYPIAKLLDWLLHDEEETSSMYNRGELSALVRIHYEEHLATKRRHRAERTNVAAQEGQQQKVVKAILLDATIREAKRELQQAEIRTNNSSVTEASAPSMDQRSPSIHFDEVSMVEGALSMKTKMAVDVYTPLRKIFAIPYDTILDERTAVSIYSSGYSRIPVYDKNPKKPKDVSAIRGVLMTKQLIVIDSSDQRPISTLPLFTPACVSPKKNLVDLINMFQAGKHMALVCARPSIGNAALERGEALPPSTGLMGVITLEDVLEQLLQEQILDETDKLERNEQRLAKWVSSRWHLFVTKQKIEREEALFRQSQDPKMLDIVSRAMAELNGIDAPRLTDTSPLLGIPDGNEDKGSERRTGFLGIFK